MVVKQKNTGNKILSTGYKVSGWHLRLKAISTIIFGIILVLLGIVLAIVLKSFGLLTLSFIGLLALLGGWIYWRRARSLVKGRFY